MKIIQLWRYLFSAKNILVVARWFGFPPLYERFNMPLTGAMLKGCSIACSSASCLPEMLGIQRYFFFNGQDIDDMSNVIEPLVTSPRERKQFASIAR